MRKDLPQAEVKMHRGAPTLFINGKAHPGTSYMTYGPDAKYFKDIAKAGIHLYSFAATPTESTYNLSKECWVSPDSFDYSHLDERAHMVLDNDPEAYFFPRLYLGTPQWWAEEHPDDLVTYDDGEGEPMPFLVGSKRVASWASQAWRRDTAEALRRLIQHVEASDYGHRVIGYHIAGGTTEEWMQWGNNDSQWCDYSPVNAARFREWLRDQYHDDGALQGAWGRDDARLATAAIPGFALRAASERDYLRDPAVAQPAIDYLLYNSWLVADTVSYFCGVVKEETRRQRLAGVFYGYVLLLAGVATEQNSGHLALRQVLDYPDIDFVTSPSSYAFRDLGTGFPHAMAPVDSVKLHGKLWFDENDYRTWLEKRAPVGWIGKPDTYEGTLLQQQREFAWVLVNHLGMWWFDMAGGWFDDPRILKDLAQMERIAQSCAGGAGESLAEIAYVVDTRSSAYLKCGNAFAKEGVLNQLLPLGHIGAPFDSIELMDLDCARPYKLYIFPNCIAPSEAGRALIEEKVKARGAAVLWIGPAGVTLSGRLNEADMGKLTGLPLRLHGEAMPWQIRPAAAAAGWGWRDPQPFGQESVTGLVAVPQPGGHTVLGAIAGSDLPGLIATETGGALTMFSSVPNLPAPLMRALAEKAGVHMYTPGLDIVWASEEFLAVSVKEGGVRDITLPQPRTITNLWTGECLGRDASTFQAKVPDAGTGLYRLG